MQGVEGADRELLDAAALVGHLVPAGSMFWFLAEHRQQLFPDEQFADLFPSLTGRPSIPAPVAAAIMVLQKLHDYSDRQTAEAVRCDLRWKVACGLPLDHRGLDASTLVYWRRRLAASDRPNRIFEVVADVVQRTGVLGSRKRRVVDSTILEDAVATQDTVTRLIAAIRRVGRLVPGAAERIAAECRGHVAAEPTTGLVTDCALTKAGGTEHSDPAVAERLLAGEHDAEVVRRFRLRYGTGELRAALAAAGHTAIIKPKPLRQAVQGGFTLDDFAVDEAAATVTCPNGITRPITPSRNVTFGAACRHTPLRGRCTSSKSGRTLILHPHDGLLRQARRRWATDPTCARPTGSTGPTSNGEGCANSNVAGELRLRTQPRPRYHDASRTSEAVLRAIETRLRRAVPLDRPVRPPRPRRCRQGPGDPCSAPPAHGPTPPTAATQTPTGWR